MIEDFKTCPSCSHCWRTIEDLILDKDLALNGYQASFDDIHEGLFLLTHNVAGCGTTLAIPASRLKSLCDGYEHKAHMEFTSSCEGHCMHEGDFDSCSNECDMRWARDIMQVLKNHGPEEFLKKLRAA